MHSILFIHENFPAQFGKLAEFLAQRGWRVMFATGRKDFSPDAIKRLPNGVELIGYHRAREVGDTHPYLVGTERAILNAQAFGRTGSALAKVGFAPDLVVAHSGWGSGSFAKVIWPETKLIQYLEWWYRYPLVDAPLHIGSRGVADDHARTLVRNLPFLLDFQQADLVLCPTAFQADQAPEFMQEHIVVQHDGVDFSEFRPSRQGDARFGLTGLPEDADFVSFAARGMEPTRGFPTFMEAVQTVMNARPDIHVVIAGDDKTHYGARAPDGTTWKKAALSAHALDATRVHFTGFLPKATYAQMLRRSAAHVYLSRPFVLSWSLIEAMATGCPLVVSDVRPVRDAILDSAAAHFVPEEDSTATANAIITCLADPIGARAMGARARACGLPRYDSAICHPAMETIFTDVIAPPDRAASDQAKRA